MFLRWNIEAKLTHLPGYLPDAETLAERFSRCFCQSDVEPVCQCLVQLSVLSFIGPPGLPPAGVEGRDDRDRRLVDLHIDGAPDVAGDAPVIALHAEEEARRLQRGCPRRV